MLSRRLLVPLAVVPFAVGTLLTGSASAAPAAPASGFVTTSVQPDVTATQATVKIVKGRWSKAAITSGYVKSGGTCTKAKSIAFTNTTSVKQPFTFNGMSEGAIPAHKTLSGCISAPKAGTGTFKLTKSGDTLKVTFR